MDKGPARIKVRRGGSGGRYVAIGNTFTARFHGTCTDRRPFNLVVALVICINGVIVGFEADLGLLGTGGRDWGSVKEDLNLLGYHGDALAQAKDVVHEALSIDRQYENKMSKYAIETLANHGTSM